MKTLRDVLMVAAVVALTAAAAPPAAAADGVVVAGPVAIATNYLTRVVVIEEGDGLTFYNLDPTNWHDVVSVDTGEDGPLFSSDLIGVGGSSEVRGVSDLAAGEYAFYCSPHSLVMRGTLLVV